MGKRPSGNPQASDAALPARACMIVRAAFLVASAATPLAAAPHAPSGAVVALTTQPGSRLERDAKHLAAEDLASAARAGEKPVMLVGSARLGTGRAGAAALFVQVQSASLCGSAGCSTSVFLKRGKTWSRVLDSVSGPIKVAPGSHGGMHDLLVHVSDRWVWDGQSYKDTLPAPPIKLK